MASTALTFLPNGRVSPSYAGFLAHTTLFVRCSRCSALAASSTLMVSMAWFTLDVVMVDNETDTSGNGSNGSSSSSSAAAARQPRSSAAAEAGATGAAGTEERRPRRRRERRRRVVCAPLCLASYSDTRHVYASAVCNYISRPPPMRRAPLGGAHRFAVDGICVIIIIIIIVS